MKILLINNLHYRKGGADEVYFNTAELLRHKGHEVAFFALDNEKNEPLTFSRFFPKKIDYRNESFFNKLKSIKSFIFNQNAEKGLSDLLVVFKPDVAHVHLFLGGLTTSVIKILKEKNIPIVHTIHDYRLICPAYTFLDRKNNVCESCNDGFFLRCFFKRCSLEGRFSHSAILSIDAYYRKYVVDPVKLIDHFIFVSQFSKSKHEQFNNYFNLKSSVLYNFCPGMFTRTNFRGDYFLFYGRLSREKGIELLIKTAKSLKLKLKIVGSGPLSQELSSNSDGNIEFLGYKRGNELWNLIRNCSYVVVPSEWYENNPLTIIESFSFGKPVIGSNIGGISELIQSNRGYLFDPKNGDSLSSAFKTAVSTSDSDYAKMSQNAFEFAQFNFSEGVHYESLIKIYKNCII